MKRKATYLQEQFLKLFEGKSLLILEETDMEELVHSAISGLRMTIEFLEDGMLDEDESQTHREARIKRLHYLISELSAIPPPGDRLSPFILNLTMN